MKTDKEYKIFAEYWNCLSDHALCSIACCTLHLLPQCLLCVYCYVLVLCMRMCMCMSLESTVHHAYESLHSQDACMGTHQQGKWASPPTSSLHQTSPDHVLHSKWSFVFLLTYRTSPIEWVCLYDNVSTWTKYCLVRVFFYWQYTMIQITSYH
jgi:hypothetical protein